MKYFHMIFHLLKRYLDQNLNLNYANEITAHTIFNTNFFKFIINFHFYDTFIKKTFS